MLMVIWGGVCQVGCVVVKRLARWNLVRVNGILFMDRVINIRLDSRQIAFLVVKI